MKTIWMTVENTETDEEAWIEQWTGYLDSMDEEYAADHILETLDTFNANLRRPYETPRNVISFVLEDVRDGKKPRVVEAEESDGRKSGRSLNRI